MEGDPHDDRAVVIGAGQGRGDRHQRQGRAFEGASEIHLPTAWKGWAPGPAATLVVPISEAEGQLGLACSARPDF